MRRKRKPSADIGQTELLRLIRQKRDAATDPQHRDFYARSERTALRLRGPDHRREERTRQ